jgi:hypothetical protein
MLAAAARRAWKISLATSATPRTMACTNPYGLRKKARYERLWPRPFVGSCIVDIVR